MSLTQPNTVLVFGDRIGTGNPNNKTVYLAATFHDWDRPTRIRNVGRDALEITARCRLRYNTRRGRNTDDDLTVTICLDEGTPQEDITDCYFDDVDYEA